MDVEKNLGLQLLKKFFGMVIKNYGGDFAPPVIYQKKLR